MLAACSNAEKSEDFLIVLSVDGFRWDYTEGVHTPNFDKMAEMGVKANSLRPSFPSKIFPNHYAMVTRIYPDNHGIILNSFYTADLIQD